MFRRGPQFFEPSITFERNSKKGVGIYGDCGCSLARKGSLCTHMAAVMIAWVRKPQGFEEEGDRQRGEVDEEEEERKLAPSEFEEARQRVERSLKELVNCIVENGSSRTDDLEVLQKTYSKLRLWTNHVKEGGNGTLAIENASQPDKKFQPMIREFSVTINSISFAIMSAIESKYKLVGATDLYNSTTVSTFARMLESFVESASYNIKGVDSSIVEGARDSKEKKEEEGMLRKKNVRNYWRTRFKGKELLRILPC